ncbi:Molecular chaperone GrpE (heat shock protein) [Desulfacinum hydrothermale DSM 13146]|uniref:Molecular chaperone GrpE (Heat shock protein) n=2 Tax=Desulfacinum hydrothermale TaxID=109258 RepID=A0A1W1XVB2_9BACT|nr:Molecular chaperone GrpE (heat shock protein) [Desulfacinum hydrothermale DSM 13146]
MHSLFGSLMAVAAAAFFTYLCYHILRWLFLQWQVIRAAAPECLEALRAAREKIYRFSRYGILPSHVVSDPTREELKRIQKLLRKQLILLENLEKNRKIEASSPAPAPSVRDLLECADGLHYLHNSLRELPGYSERVEEGFEIVWHKLETVLSLTGLALLRQRHVPFDPKYHQAVENRAPGSRDLQVIQVLVPGVLQDGRLMRPAKVVLDVPKQPCANNGGKSL